MLAVVVGCGSTVVRDSRSPDTGVDVPPAAYEDATCWNAPRQSNPICNNGTRTYRVVRGGGWGDSVPASVRAAERINYIFPSVPYDGVGFRCAQGAP